MQGVILSIVTGILISIQTVFNARVSERVGSWATTTLVLGLGFIASLPIFYLNNDTSLFKLENINKLYLFSGVIGVGIVFCIMKGIRHIGPAYAVSVVLVSQFTVALLIDTFGWFGFDTMTITWNKVVGICIILLGIILFKLKR
ncbi:DMT family transporter [Cytobacillus sp. Hm23]|uniref:DMT family transporter n=1 Tax=Cytobacillus sp. IB215665 TaxID=3097357 RepID=UPI002A0B2280|nr:DMT family transporter [Cytobacillus sp. IB215665]MDX8367372.1 DMT family transporter [Cytobacillus sp. IB215665]